MNKIIGITGEPGSGKTYSIKTILSNNQKGEWFTYKSGLLRFHKNELRKTIILGLYDNTSVFDGTDRLSMAVQPDAEKFFLDNFLENYLIIFEGDRLFNCKYLCFIESLQNTIASWFCIDVDSEICQKQRDKRGTKQPDSFIKSRKTKIENISKTHFLQKVTQQDLLLFLKEVYEAQ
jgi:ABC-type dipeptide/oligopeptide/nickel transport system ATPase component